MRYQTKFLELSTYPFRHKEDTLKTTGLMLGLIATDYYTSKYIVQDILNPTFDMRYPDINLISEFSAPENLLMASLGSLYIGSLVRNDETGQRAVLMSLKAFLYSYSFTHIGLKNLFARHRPNSPLGTDHGGPQTNDPWNFFNFHKVYWKSNAYGTAFPSFHVTLAFSVATVFGNVYDNTLLYHAVWMTLTLPEFEGHHHWTSDMVFGAIIGTIIGHEITKEQNISTQQHPEPGTTHISPIFSMGHIGFNIRYHL